MKGFIEVKHSGEKKRIFIAISAIIAVRDNLKGGTSIVLTETSLGGESVTLRVNHTYEDVVARIEEAH